MVSLPELVVVLVPLLLVLQLQPAVDAAELAASMAAWTPVAWADVTAAHTPVQAAERVLAEAVAVRAARATVNFLKNCMVRLLGVGGF